jgi:hypothetical protein
MANNLLIVFGGTTEDTVVFESQDTSLKSSGLFTNDELDNVSVDVLQINLLTTYPSVSFRASKSSAFKGLNGVWLLADSGGIMRNLNAKRSYFLDNDLDDSLQSMADLIQEVNWSHGNYTENSDARGMTVKAFNEFSRGSKELIVSFLSGVQQAQADYDQVFLLAHSRGCGLATQLLSDRDINDKDDIKNMQLANNSLTNKLKRIVLLDPVSKNATDSFGIGTNLNKILIPANAQLIEILSHKNKEIHIISKAKSTSFRGVSTNYESYVDVLVGAKKHKKHSEISNSINMRNIYVHIADMAHEGMLSKELHEHFKEYKNIITDLSWSNIYFNDQKVSSRNFGEYSSKIQLEDRRTAFEYCIKKRDDAS